MDRTRRIEQDVAFRADLGVRFRVVVHGRGDVIGPAVGQLRRLAETHPELVLEIVSVASASDGADGAQPKLLEALAGAALAVVFIDGSTGFDPAARATCLLAYHLTGAAPLLVLAGDRDSDDGSFRRATTDWDRYAHDLGIAPPDRKIIDAGSRGVGSDASIAETAAQLAGEWLARSKASAAMRGWIIGGGSDDPADRPTLHIELVSGRIAPGDDVVLLPSATPARVAAIERVPAGDNGIGARFAVTLDRPIANNTDRVISAGGGRPEQADQVVAHVVWLGRKPMLPGRRYVARIGTQITHAQIGLLKHRLHPTTLEPIAARRLAQGEVGLCNVAFSEPLVFDAADRSDPSRRASSRFAIEDAVDGGRIGQGEIAFTLRRATNIHWQAQSVDKAARAALKGQRPACLWFTGLSGSGKSTIASGLEKRLNAMGRHTYTLDGDNVRHGLNRDLGFTDADRVENIRRIAEVAKLFVDAGLLVLVSFISPFRAERRLARSLHGADEFLEIFVDTPLEICERRDPKGLYAKARAGQLKNFTGIDSPYEPPDFAEISVSGGDAPPDVLVERVLDDLRRRGIV